MSKTCRNNDDFGYGRKKKFNDRRKKKFKKVQEHDKYISDRPDGGLSAETQQEYFRLKK